MKQRHYNSRHGRAVAIWPLALAVLQALVLSGCGKETATAAPAAATVPEVGVITIQPQSLTVTNELPGRTSAYRIAQVRARVDGIVTKRTYAEGSDVQAGQLLFQIDPAPYQAALASAQANLSRAQANLVSTTALAERDKVLIEGNAISKQDYDNAIAGQSQAAADVAAGQAAVLTANINLGYTEVRAPVSGRIGAAQVTEGGYVQASSATLLATVQQLHPIYVDLNQTSVEGLRLRREVASGRLQLHGPRQARVHLTLEDGSAYALEGTLEFTDVTVDPGTGMVTVRALFPNPQHVLLPGMFVRAQIDEGVNAQTVLVPQVGVTHNAKGEATALVVGEDNKVLAKTIVTGRTVGAQWVVESGLQASDRVIVEGGQRLQPGQIVRPVESRNPQGRSVSASIVTDPTHAPSQANSGAPPVPPPAAPPAVPSAPPAGAAH
jgi:membrane fusion protein (multidrug efflux system)